MDIKRCLAFALTYMFIQIGFGQTCSKELVCNAGDEFINDSYQLSWSIGEPLVEAYSCDKYTLSY